MMGAETFLLAVAQAESVRYDKDANLEKARNLMRRAAAEGAAAILFPEMFLTGYTVWDRLADLAEPTSGPSMKRLAQNAREFRLHVVCGFPEQGDGGRFFNSACLIDPEGGLVGAYRKTHLFDREPQFFAPGDDLPVFDTTLGRVGLAICYDIEFPEVARLLAMRGARLILNPTANMEPFAPYQEVFLRSRAMENGVYVAAANTVGHDEFYRYFGASAAIDPRGSVLCKAGGSEELLFASIDLGVPVHENLEYLEQRRPDLYGGLSGDRN